MIKIAVLKEAAAGECRVAATPETVKKFIGLGASLFVEKGAGAGASISDVDYEAAGATLGTGSATAKDARQKASEGAWLQADELYAKAIPSWTKTSQNGPTSTG